MSFQRQKEKNLYQTKLLDQSLKFLKPQNYVEDQKILTEDTTQNSRKTNKRKIKTTETNYLSNFLKEIGNFMYSP